MASVLSVLKSAINFTRSGATIFAAIGNLIPGESRLLGARVGVGFSTVSGIARVTAAAPGTDPGTLTFEQSIDGTNWEVTNSFEMLPATNAVPFSVRVVGTYIRAQFTVPDTEVMSLRFGATMRVVD